MVQGVPGNVRQPAGTEQARRVALDGQGGQRREPEQLAGLHEQGGPAAVGNRESDVYPAGGGQRRAGARPLVLPGASVRCRTDRILLIGPPPRLKCVIHRSGTLRRSAHTAQAPSWPPGTTPADVFC